MREPGGLFRLSLWNDGTRTTSATTRSSTSPPLSPRSASACPVGSPRRSKRPLSSSSAIPTSFDPAMRESGLRDGWPGSASRRRRRPARAIVLCTVEGRRHCPHPGVGRLARAVADNSLRRELRTRLHHVDSAVARRALRMIVNVRHPGLTPEDIAAAQVLVLTDAGRGQWLSPTVARLAVYLWSSEWEAELRSLLPHHGPDRAAAKRLIDLADRRRSRRPGP